MLRVLQQLQALELPHGTLRRHRAVGGAAGGPREHLAALMPALCALTHAASPDLRAALSPLLCEGCEVLLGGDDAV